jgi:hypothetical protein
MLIAAGGLILAACDPSFHRAEFAPPQDRWPASQPSTVWRDTPAPPVLQQYCYRSLAATDCYLEPQPHRPGFTGTYPEIDR